MFNYMKRIRKIRNEIFSINENVNQLALRVAGIEKLLIFDKVLRVKSSMLLKKISDYSLVRVGRVGDGGYIMVDNFVDRGVAYSFGISDEISWDKDMANRGYDVFMYDHTINSLSEQNDRFHWVKSGLAEQDGVGLCNTLRYQVEKNQHENLNRMILKIDIEGAEWKSLNSVDGDMLLQFDQIVLELHFGLESSNNSFFIDNYLLIVAVLDKLSRTHHLVHVHGNNYGNIMNVCGFNFPSCLEVLYVNKKFYDVTEYVNDLPICIDSPNDPMRDDIVIGRWN